MGAGDPAGKHRQMPCRAAGGSQGARAEAEAREKSEAGGGGGGIGGPVAEMIAALRKDVRRLQEDLGRGAGAGGDGPGAGLEYQCIHCSLIHSSTACPSCGSAERRVYGGGGGGR